MEGIDKDKRGYWDQEGTRKSRNSQDTLGLGTIPKTTTQPTVLVPEITISTTTSTTTNNPATTTTMGPLTASTPAVSPSYDHHRPSNETDASGSEFFGFETPHTGNNAPHEQLIEQDKVDLSKCKETEIHIFINKESVAVESLGDSFMEKDDWKMLYDSMTKDTHQRITDLITACKQRGLVIEIAQLYKMRSKLEANYGVLKSTALRDIQLSQNVRLRPSGLTPASARSKSNPPTDNSIPGSATSTIGGISRLQTDMGLDVEDEEGEYNSATELSHDLDADDNTISGRPGFVRPSQIRSMESHISRIDDRKVDKTLFTKVSTNLNKRLTDVEMNRVRKNELSSAMQRVCSLEVQMKDLTSLKIFDEEDRREMRTLKENNESCMDAVRGVLNDNLRMTETLQRIIRQTSEMNQPQPTTTGGNRTTSRPVFAQQTTTVTVPGTSGQSHIPASTNTMYCNTFVPMPSAPIDLMNSPPFQMPSQPNRITILPRVPQPGSQQHSDLLLQQFQIPGPNPPNTMNQVPGHYSANSPPMPGSSRQDLNLVSPQGQNSSTNLSQDPNDNQYHSRVKNRLKRASANLSNLLNPQISSSLTRSKITSLHKSSLNMVMQERRELEKLIEKYEHFPSNTIDFQIILHAEDVVSSAQTWCSNLVYIYDQLDCANKPVDSKLFEGLGKYSEHSETSIYEFLKKFDTIMEDRGSKDDRAALLYEQHLDQSIQLMTVDVRGDLEKLKAWLIKRFGEPRTMCTNILKIVTTKENLPADSTVTGKLVNYYRNLDAALKRILELKTLPGLPVDKLLSHVYGTDFLNSLSLLLPEKARNELYVELTSKNLEVMSLQGEATFNLITTIISKHSKMVEGMASSSGLIIPSKTGPPRPERESLKRQKGSHAAASRRNQEGDDYDTEEDDDQRSFNPTTHHTEKSNQRKDNSRPEKRNSNPNRNLGKDGKNDTKSPKNFPCSLHHNKHELGECQTFFNFKSKKRRVLAEGNTCFHCLKPYRGCKEGCKSKVPEALICKGCTEIADSRGLSPLNILFCSNEKHKEDLKEEQILSALKAYLTGFDPEKLGDKMILANHILFAGHVKHCTRCKGRSCKCAPTTLTRKPNPKDTIPRIHTKSGEEIEVEDDHIIPESVQDAFYVMQILNLKGQDALTFYDRGANHHMIRGELAEDASLKVVSDKPVQVGVVGGGKVWTQYGSYTMSLGPTEDGLYHDITAQGITNITDKFPHYDLTDINKEFRQSGQYQEYHKLLPKYIGGQEASLLIGIKDTGLEPVLLFQLPCGLGVFKSPLMDKFGSRICYGGPHSVFTDANAKKGFNHLSIHFLKMIKDYNNSLYPQLSGILEPEIEETAPGLMMAKNNISPIKVNHAYTHDLYTSALDEIDLQEMGFAVEEPIDSSYSECTCGDDFTTLDAMEDQTSIMEVHKAKIPVSKRKEYVDQDDQEIGHYRCETCISCPRCGMSSKTRMISLQEKMEQEAIKKSIHIDLENKKVFVDLPFMKEPVSALKAKHNGQSDNYGQALRVYKTQCKKPDVMKNEMTKVHKNLVEKGFMAKLSDLSPNQQAIIENAEFKHYMPWRIAEKPDSVSTPYRCVVDASMTGLNDILAKGENRMSKIPDILTRNRCRKYMWSSDISKLYNQLHLNDPALPYGLFLFRDELDPSAAPEIYVMLTAWYGVTPVGNQSSESLLMLASTLEDLYPLAKMIISKDLYVDDTISGANTKEEREKQIQQMSECMAMGGFKFKYVVKSEEDPCDEASSDKTSLKILGYKWLPKIDTLHPGFTELNFNKKLRGAKRPNRFPVVSANDVTTVLQDIKISRRIVASKVAEFYDPIGLWEPLKLQMKLDNVPLKGLDWDSELPPDLQDIWTDRFKQMLSIPYMDAPRCIVPADAKNPDRLRLICMSDAAEEAGGCAIYGGFEREDGSFSCDLLLARSKLMNQKVPRNELEGIKLMAETATAIKNTLGEKISDIIYCTDSTIALCWCHNLSKKLRMFTLYRVAEIRQHILGAVYPTDDITFPLFHIDGILNPADLVTKRHSILPDTISSGSTWQQGYPWMRLPTNEMPLTSYDDLRLSKEDLSAIDQECFPEPILTQDTPIHYQALHSKILQGSHCTGCNEPPNVSPTQSCYGTNHEQDHCCKCSCDVTFSSFSLKVGKGPQELVDLIKHGWQKSLGILSRLRQTYPAIKHRTHKKKGTPTSIECEYCEAHVSDIYKNYREEAMEQLFRAESSRIKSILPQKKLNSFILKDNIFFYESRLNQEFQTEDIDADIFFDQHEIKGLLPVVSADSDMFFSYVMYVHHVLRPHSGVEITLKEVCKIMMPINNPRKIIQAIRKDCPRCRLIAKKTVELRMMNHPSARTTLAPPYYISQMDTVFGFKAQVFKNARKTMKVYALIICCLLTGATNILVIEGLETRDVLQAIERHATRHGMPSVLYVDNGTQLIALDNTKFSIRELNGQLIDAYGMQVRVSNAKSHEERGRIEARVKILRTMLDKLSVNSDTPLSVLQWETLFSRISNMVNDLPIAKGEKTKVDDPGWDLITPNRLLLGRNNNRSLEGWISLKTGTGHENLLRKNQAIMRIWYKIFTDRVHHLIPRPGKWTKTDKIQIDDICLFMYNENPGVGKDTWKLGRIVEMPKQNRVVIAFPGPSKKLETPALKHLSRCPRDVAIIHAAGEIDLNSREYLENLIKNNKESK